MVRVRVSATNQTHRNDHPSAGSAVIIMVSADAHISANKKGTLCALCHATGMARVRVSKESNPVEMMISGQARGVESRWSQYPKKYGALPMRPISCSSVKKAREESANNR